MKSQSDTPARGTPEEQQTFKDVFGHYKISKEDLEMRIQRKNGFDDADKMFASFINPSDWPYKSIIFDPRPYTVIVEKSARLIGSKPKGRLVPRESGDALGAAVNNELLSFQWDDNTRLSESMIAKWITMDQTARKYGSAFGICKWKYITRIDKDGKKKCFYDGPDFVVCKARDVLANPSYDTINKWFQHREYVTYRDLKDTNDTAKTDGAKYKNLDIIKEKLNEEAEGKGDQRSTEYVVKNKSIRGLTDYLGRDVVNKTIEIVTEYQPDRWITFAPRYGTVIRDIPNPYGHGEIPVVHLKYYPLADDLYGVNEFEPVSKLIRGINSLMSQYIDNITVDLYPPLMINPVNVRMHTIEFTPEAKWLMNNPGVDVQRMQTSTTATNNFNAAYSIMVSSLLNAWGESSQGVSQVNPTQDAGNVTATEIKDTAFTRNVRDNMNQIFLSEALKKQIMFWHSMNQQFLFKGTTDQVKVIRIVGRDAIQFFKKQGLNEIQPTEDDVNDAMMGNLGDPNAIIPEGPRYPVETADGNVVPKFVEDESGNGGDLMVEKGDLIGDYDYIPDIETMQAPSNEKVEQKMTMVLGTITNPAITQQLAAEGRRVKVEEVLVKLYESTNVIKDAEQFFEDIPQQPQMPGMPGQVDVQNQAVAGGNTPPEAGLPNQGTGVPSGMAGSPIAVA